MISQFLSELDGIEELKGVVVLAATNRLDRVDPALQRPGRFEFLVELPVPDEETRLAILAVHTRDMPLADDVDLAALAAETKGSTGADIEGLCQQAGLLAIREFLDDNDGPATDDTSAPLLKIDREHFQGGLTNRQGRKSQ